MFPCPETSHLVGLKSCYAKNSVERNLEMISKDKLSNTGRQQTKRRKLKRLTPEQIAKLCSEYEAGESAADLATKYHLHKGTVFSYLKNNKIKLHRKNQFNEGELKQAIGLYGEGYSLKRLAVQFKIDPTTVRKELVSAGIAIRKRGF